MTDEQGFSTEKVRDARRRVLRYGIGLPFAFGALARASFALAAPTPECDEHGEATPRQMEGPFFKPRTPQRISLLEARISGVRLQLSGRVLSTECKPIVGALLDFWQADDAGDYDNQGFRLRGHQFSDSEGHYRLETIIPGLYPGRTRHIHVKLQAPHRPLLATQIYFPGEAQNAQDFLYRPELLVKLREAAGGKDARFDFVLKLA
jgi:protocatechuate 3,4-dioxygenase beta subunit